MALVLRRLAVSLSVAVRLATTVLQPGLFGALGIFLAGACMFLVGVFLVIARAIAGASRPNAFPVALESGHSQKV